MRSLVAFVAAVLISLGAVTSAVPAFAAGSFTDSGNSGGGGTQG